MLCATGRFPALDDFAHQIGGIIDHARTAGRRVGHHRLARNMIVAEPRIASRAARLGVALFRSLKGGGELGLNKFGDKLSGQQRWSKWHYLRVRKKTP